MFQVHSFSGSCPVFPAPLIEETIFSPLYILASSVKHFISGLLIFFYRFILLFLCQYHTVMITVMITQPLGLYSFFLLVSALGGWGCSSGRLCLGRTCACLLRRGGEFFPSGGQGCVRWYFVSVGSWSADDWVCFCLACSLGEESCTGCCWVLDTGGSLHGSSPWLTLHGVRSSLAV